LPLGREYLHSGGQELFWSWYLHAGDQVLPLERQYLHSVDQELFWRWYLHADGQDFPLWRQYLHFGDEDLTPESQDLHYGDQDLSPGRQYLHAVDQDLLPGPPNPAHCAKLNWALSLLPPRFLIYWLYVCLSFCSCGQDERQRPALAAGIYEGEAQRKMTVVVPANPCASMGPVFFCDLQSIRFRYA